MKLVKQTSRGWQYLLEETEFKLLSVLVNRFPFDDPGSAKISATDHGPEAKEREKLLNESLAEHRRELEKTAGQLLAPEKIQRKGNGVVMKISSEERETLLQILNDIRVGCWHALGQPEELEPESADLSPQELTNYSLMNIAGYFEHSLVVTEE